jgi:hypothetical protein
MEVISRFEALAGILFILLFVLDVNTTVLVQSHNLARIELTLPEPSSLNPFKRMLFIFRSELT